jgi:Xaa-Pro aminopeptidase
MRTVDFSKIKSDCCLITSEANRLYISGFKSSAGAVLCFKDKTYLLVDFRYYEKALSQVGGSEVVLVGELYPELEQLLKKHQARTVAVETESMTLGQLSRYREKLPAYQFDEDPQLSLALTEARMCKSDYEIECISQAQGISEQAFIHILEFIKPGMTEREIAFELERFMLTHGADGLSFETIVLTGANASIPHGSPGFTPVKNGDFVLMDFGAVVKEYHGDMTRTVCVGTPTDEQIAAYETVLKASQEAFKILKSGVKAQDVDRAAREVIEIAGYKEAFGHSLGHGSGIEIHEAPALASKSDTVLKTNMVVTVEPGIYLKGKFGIRLEDLAVITDNGYRNMNLTGKNLIKISN